MKYTLFGLAPVFLAGLPMAAAGQSFDCADARGQSDIAICKNAELQDFDNELMRLYQAVLRIDEASARVVGRAAWTRRQACEGDIQCLRSEYQVALLTFANWSGNAATPQMGSARPVPRGVRPESPANDNDVVIAAAEEPASATGSATSPDSADGGATQNEAPPAAAPQVKWDMSAAYADLARTKAARTASPQTSDGAAPASFEEAACRSDLATLLRLDMNGDNAFETLKGDYEKVSYDIEKLLIGEAIVKPQSEAGIAGSCSAHSDAARIFTSVGFEKDILATSEKATQYYVEIHETNDMEREKIDLRRELNLDVLDPYQPDPDVLEAYLPEPVAPLYATFYLQRDVDISTGEEKHACHVTFSRTAARIFAAQTGEPIGVTPADAGAPGRITPDVQVFQAKPWGGGPKDWNSWEIFYFSQGADAAYHYLAPNDRLYAPVHGYIDDFEETFDIGAYVSDIRDRYSHDELTTYPRPSREESSVVQSGACQQRLKELRNSLVKSTI